MKEAEVKARAFAMPLTSPAYPPGPYRFIDREFMIITYRTDPDKLRAVVPEPLEVDEPLVRMVHAAGCRIHAWTVNEVGDLEHLVRLGVDGLCGNYPDRIRVALAARGGSTARV